MLLQSCCNRVAIVLGNVSFSWYLSKLQMVISRCFRVVVTVISPVDFNLSKQVLAFCKDMLSSICSTE